MPRFLIAGDVQGQFDVLLSKIDILKQKGQIFDFLLCVGKTLSLDFNFLDYKLGKKVFPLPVFFIDASELSASLNIEYPEGKELCQNLFFLGKTGILEHPTGLNIAFISGVESKIHYQLQSEYYADLIAYTGALFSYQDVNNLKDQLVKNGYNVGDRKDRGLQKKVDDKKRIDIFLSNQWPSFQQNLLNDFRFNIENQSMQIAQLTDYICPRYHFVGLEGIFFERIPYINNNKYLTRLISLGKVGDKVKYLSAFDIVPISKIDSQELYTLSDIYTKNPYSIAFSDQFSKGKREDEQDEDDDINVEENVDQSKNVTDQIHKEKQINEEEKVQQQTDNSSQQQQQIVKSIFFSNFDSRTRDDDISEFLSRFGKIKKLDLVYDQKTKQHKGYGFLEFEDVKKTAEVINDSGKYTLHGRKIYFNPSKQRDQKQQNQAQSGENQSQGDKQPKEQVNCWFCMDSPSLDNSLIFHQTENFYLALDKGPISKMHFLIIPKTHIQSYFSLKKSQIQEINDLKLLMNKIFSYYHQKSLICFERYVRLNNNISHQLIHCVPVEINKIDSFKYEFEQIVKENNLHFFLVGQKEFFLDFVKDDEYYFYLEAYHGLNLNQPIDKTQVERFVLAINSKKHFPIDFGRQIICKIFHYNTLDWKSCKLNETDKQKQITDLSSLVKFNNLI